MEESVDDSSGGDGCEAHLETPRDAKQPSLISPTPSNIFLFRFSFRFIIHVKFLVDAYVVNRYSLF